MEGYLEVWGEARWNLNIGGRRQEDNWKRVGYCFDFFFSVCVFKDYYPKSIRVLALGVIGKVINMNFGD